MIVSQSFVGVAGRESARDEAGWQDQGGVAAGSKPASGTEERVVRVDGRTCCGCQTGQSICGVLVVSF